MTAFDILAQIDADADRAGIPIYKVAQHAGISPGLVSRWRSKTYEPRLSSLQRLRDSLTQLTLGDLL